MIWKVCQFIYAYLFVAGLLLGVTAQHYRDECKKPFPVVESTFYSGLTMPLVVPMALAFSIVVGTDDINYPEMCK